MKRILTGVMATLVAGSSLMAAAPAEARRDWGDRYERRWDGDRGWRDGRGWDNRRWRGDRWGRGYGYYAPPRRYYAPRYGYGYGYGYPRDRFYYRDRGDGALIGAIAGLAIGAAIASGN